ncbi:MAG: nucleotidyltransferase family protein [Firmicutes bacterium]|nr:nucleotidyltransferase family protein [Bacillota bacterium]
MKYHAYITAGGRISGDFASKAGTDIKAMIKINGKSLIQRAIYALIESGSVGKIVVVAPEEVKKSSDVRGADDFISADADGVENILKGLKYFSGEKHVLLCNSDLPFITADSVRGFVERCPEDALICYPVYEQNEIDPVIRPGVPSYIKLKDGHYTGGAILRLETEACIERIEQIGKSFNSRKSAFAMASLLGWGIVVKFLLGQCSLTDILKRVEKIMGGRCAAIRGCDPGITIDIDDETSWQFSVDYANRHNFS